MTTPEQTPENQTKITKKPHTKKVVVAIIFLILLVVIGAYLAHKHSQSIPRAVTVPKPLIVKPVSIKPAEVVITSKGFVPQTISILRGQGVIWNDQDTASHSVISDVPKTIDSVDSIPNSGQSIVQGSSFSYVFARPGTYTYHDSSNYPDSHGTVVVH